VSDEQAFGFVDLAVGLDQGLDVVDEGDQSIASEA
jgi:hypothetical protein